jgi:hypothetical protein
MMSASQRDVHFIPWHNDVNEQYLRSQGYVLFYTYKRLKLKVKKKKSVCLSNNSGTSKRVTILFYTHYLT